MGPRARPMLLPMMVVAMLIAQAAVVAMPQGTVAVGLAEGTAMPEGLTGFLENGGQVDRSVGFYAWTGEGGIALMEGGVLVTLVDSTSELGCNVLFKFVDPTITAPEGRDAMPGVTNIIRGNDPAGWHAGLRTYSQVVYPDIWDGIDLIYRSEGGQLKYDLALRPGSDPADVLFGLSGHDDIMVDARGDLVVTTVAGVIRDTGLVAFYANEPTETIDCGFLLAGDDTYGFHLGEFDPSRTVVIDPLVYSTYVGGGNGELEEPVAGVVVDGNGRALVAGQTNTTDFPVTVGTFQAFNAGGETDLFVLCMTADGSDVEWSTYLGGTGADYPYDIAVDGNGLPVVVGRTNSTDFPTTFGAYDTTHTGSDHEGFIVKLKGEGTALAFSTYLGGNNTDELAAVVLDDTDNVYVAGNTLSSDLPTSVGAAFPNHTGTSFDAFIAKVNPSGSSLEGLTYLGGSKWDVAVALDVDDQGWVYVGGETISTDFPATNGTFQDFLMNNLTRDGFIAKVSPDLDSIGWATYIGGMFNDYVEFLHVDGNGSVYAAGDTESGMFPVTNNSFQTVHEGASDTFILRMAANGSQLEYSTFLGGSNDDYCEGFAVDDAGRACVAGSTLSVDFPTMTGVQQEVRAGKFDTFIFRLDADGATPLYSTYLGGTEWDLANGLSQDADRKVYIVGATDSTDFPTTAGAYQEDHGGHVDVFITKLDLFLDTERPTAFPGTDMIVDQHDTVDFDGSTSTDNVAVVNWTWELTYNGTDEVLFGPSFSWTFHLAGKYYVYLTVGDAVGLTDRQWVSVFVNDTEMPVAVAPDHITGQQHWTITLDGGASHDNVGVEEYIWTFTYGGEEQRLTGMKMDFTFDEAGLFDITLTVKDAAGNMDADMFTVAIHDITAPDLVIAETDIQVDQHTEVRFDASASMDNVHITNISWQFVYAGSPVVLYGHVPTFTFDRAGTYSVTVTAEDANGNRAFDEVRVTVVDITPPVAMAGQDVTIDQRGVVTLDAGGSSDNVGIVEWQWTVTLGEEVSHFSGVQNAFTFFAAGVFSVDLNVTDAAGNMDADSFTVRVRDITPPQALVGENMVIGQGDKVVFNGTGSTDNVGIVTYNWELSLRSDKDTFHEPTFEYEFTFVGTYRLVLQVFDGSGLSDLDEIQVVVLDTELPVADAGPDQDIELDGTARFEGTNSTDNVGITNFVWTFNYNQGQEVLSGTNLSFTFELQGTYTITLTVTDEAGNSATDTTSVKVTFDEGGGGGGGGASGGLGNALVWLVIAVILVVVVAAILVARSRGGDKREEEADMGWAPTEEEKRTRDEDGAGEEKAEGDTGPGEGD